MTLKAKVKNEPENALLQSTQQQTLNDYLQGYLRGIRSGDIGALPIVFGMIVIAIIFQSINSNFLIPRNLVNLISQMAAITAIGYGIVFVLLLGEIDLSVGFVSGTAAVSMTLALKGALRPEMAAGIAFFFALAVSYFIRLFLADLKVDGTPTNSKFPVLDFILLLCAIGMGAAFLLLPWVSFEEGSLTGGGLLVNIPFGAGIWFVPITSIIASVAAFRGIVDSASRYRMWLTIRIAGIVAVFYLIGFIIFDPTWLSALGIGYLVALAASIGMVVISFMKRPDKTIIESGSSPLMFGRFRYETVFRWLVTLSVFLICILGVTAVSSSRSLMWYEAIPIALIAAAGIGWLHGTIITFFGLPSFVVTLAGLLAWQGVVLIFIGGAGTVIVQDSVVLGVANSYIQPPELSSLVAGLFVAAFAANEFWQARTRQDRGLAFKPVSLIVLQTALLGVLAGAAVYICNQDRGLPLIGVGLILLMILLSFVATRTKFGRYVFAVGGNAEAARRAGINVQQIRVRVFMISSFMAGVGGVILASRLRSVDTNAGGGQVLLNSIAAAVIGGTSLFGGSGKVSSAILGAIIVASVDNGMGLIPNVSSGAKFIVTALVLLAAVVVDALARRSQKQSGIR